jgi:hypothetical protein
VTGLIAFMRTRNLTRAEATRAGVDEWTDVVRQTARGLLSNEIDSWMTGVNTNVDGKSKRVLNRYSGSAPEYRARCERVAAAEYPGIALS